MFVKGISAHENQVSKLARQADEQTFKIVANFQKTMQFSGVDNYFKLQWLMK